MFMLKNSTLILGEIKLNVTFYKNKNDQTDNMLEYQVRH